MLEVVLVVVVVFVLVVEEIVEHRARSSVSCGSSISASSGRNSRTQC